MKLEYEKLQSNEDTIKSILSAKVDKVATQTTHKGKYLYDKKVEFSTC